MCKSVSHSIGCNVYTGCVNPFVLLNMAVADIDFCDDQCFIRLFIRTATSKNIQAFVSVVEIVSKIISGHRSRKFTKLDVINQSFL